MLFPKKLSVTPTEVASETRDFGILIKRWSVKADEKKPPHIPVAEININCLISIRWSIL